MPKISVIMTVYNAEQYLSDSLESLFEQTFSDFELILVNDGCTDGSRDILLKYLRRPNVRLLENEHNEGIPVSRNRALLVASGEYIAIHDGDDVSLPYRFEKEVEALDKHEKVVFLGSYAAKMDHAGNVIGSMVYPPQDTPRAFSLITRYKLNPIIDPSCMYRREPVLEHGGYTMDPELRTVLDFELWCRLLCHGCLMSNIQEPLIKYRINPNGVTRTENSKMVEATDIVWAAFRRKNLTDPRLDPSLFRQDGFTEFSNNTVDDRREQ